ncbi:hypothetical protein GCM10010975_27360 [Comamonas phosphati]|nr:hypothetical protein GCM10010975_27360 [Comamonas phosphati]
MKTSASLAAPLAQALQPLRARWQQLAAREQNLVLAAGAVVALALLWSLAVAPALHSLGTAPARHAQADQQLQRMLKMQAQAQQLRQHAPSQPQPVGNTQALLQQSLQAELGASAKMQWLGNRAQVTLTAAPASALARWLAQVRDNTHAAASEMKLSRAAAPAADATTRWSGSLMLELPDRAAP